jgi:hypothetical protein
MDQKRLSFFKNRKYKRVILPFCLTMLLGMIMLFSMPTVAKSAGSVKPEVPAMNISKIYTENMTSPSPGLYSAAGSADQLIKLYMLASDGFWSDDQRALLQAGGATAHYSTIAYTPGGLTWSWYAPYIEHEMWVNQMRYYVPTSTPTESIWMSTLQAPLNFYENKNAWVQREVVAPIPASTS